MILTDTDIFIYLAYKKLSGDDLPDEEISFASASRVEARVYQLLTIGEGHQLICLFDSSTQYDLTGSLISRAMTIRQLNRIGLVNAIMAAKHGRI